ncbi:MAG: branched-chain amino acid transporter permease [Mailhella sp.]|nr:branched-chain amino acid transporter permease [Mailhella sp.]
MMTTAQQLATIAICSAGTVLTRFLPFAVFSEKRPTPAFIRYLGKALPSAVFGMLVVYSLRDVRIMEGSHGAAEFAALAVTVLLHLWRRNMMLSMFVGTACCMLLKRLGL